MGKRLGNDKYGQIKSGRVNAYLFSCLVQSFKFHDAVDQGENGEIFTHADVVSRMNFCADLSHNYGAGIYFLPAENFNAPALGIAVSSVTGASLTFFMCHLVLRLPLYRYSLYFHAG